MRISDWLFFVLWAVVVMVLSPPFICYMAGSEALQKLTKKPDKALRKQILVEIRKNSIFNHASLIRIMHHFEEAYSEEEIRATLEWMEKKGLILRRMDHEAEYDLILVSRTTKAI
jgi:hypothetical protein